jgi:esterase
MLATQEFDGPDDHPPCLIVHGLFGSGRNWGSIARELAQSRPVLTVDLRNHGQSPWEDTHGYDDLAADLAEVVESRSAPVDVIGHSMGGKASMMLALTRPDLVRRMIVADIAPVSYSHTQQQFIDAMRAVDLSTVNRRAEAAAALGEQGVERALQAFFTQSLDVKNKRWLYNLDALEAEMPKILSFPDVSDTFDGPVLFLSGGKSDYVRRAHRDRIKAMFPAARFARIPDAGHWLHAEKPAEFLAVAGTYLSAND